MCLKQKMKTNDNGLFIALKYGAAAMAAATAFHLYMKQNSGPNPKLIALDNTAERQRNLRAWGREPGRPRAASFSGV